MFENNSIIICNQSTKKKILERNFFEKKLNDFTFIDLESFKERFYFKISYKAIIYAMKFLNTSYENAKIIVKNIYFIDLDSNYQIDKKLTQLQQLKKKLIEENILEYDPYFIEFIKEKNIYVVDMFLDNFAIKMFKEVSNITNVDIINSEPLSKKYEVYKFDKHQQEVEYVFDQISYLLDNNIDINDIYICVESNDYDHMLYRYSSLYQIPITINAKESIKNHFIYKTFIKELSTTNDKTKALKAISELNNTYIYNSIVKLINKFYFIDDIGLFINVLDSEINNVYHENVKLDDVVKVVSLSDNFNENDHVFLIGFDNNSFPKTYKDDEYLPEKYKDILPITTYEEKNELMRSKVVYYLSKINNLYISYSLFTQMDNVISLVSEKMEYIEKEYELKPGKSKKLDQLKLGIEIDKLINYNIHNEQLDLLYSTFDDLYKTYDNSFSGIDKKLLKDKIENYINLSYTTINKFYQCQFAYYLDKVLKIKHDDYTSATILGTIYHELLENYGKEGFDLEEEKNKLNTKLEDPMLKYYFNKLWPDFLLAIEVIEEFKLETYLKSEKHEESVKVDYSDNDVIKVFTGKIDKIMYQNIDGVDYVSIIDYKTGSKPASLDNIEYGLNLQLPVYAYFLVKTKLFKNPKILGVYLHHILDKATYDVKKDILEVKRANLKLDGYSTLDRTELPIFDPTYKSSKFIKSLSITSKDVFSQHSKVFSQEDIIGMIEKVEGLIVEAFDKILEGEFPINPKTIGGKDQSCQYCPYENICYKKYSDIQQLETKKFVEKVEE